jgi:oligopeptide/dipeptide ABC transporter ATP-binding protein
MVDRDTVLSVRGLVTQFRTRESVVTAVRDVSFDLRPQERIGIVGESGCGKSALALSILGLLEPPGHVVAGGVWLNGRDIAPLSDRAMQRIRGKEIALILQDPMTALDPVKTIGSQLVEALLAHQRGLGGAAAKRLAIDLMREVDIPRAERRLDDYPHQYSGGMRQRIVIAIALANNPDVLIADEPTTALDVTTQAQVLSLLERLIEEHRTAVIFITHNLGIVAEFCDRVAVMYAGRIVELASAEHVFTAPTHPYSEALLECVPRPGQLRRGPLPAIPGFPPNLARVPAGCSFEPRCPVGHGVDRCREIAPEPVVTGDGSAGPSTAECHFVAERLAASDGMPSS